MKHARNTPVDKNTGVLEETKDKNNSKHRRKLRPCWLLSAIRELFSWLLR